MAQPKVIKLGLEDLVLACREEGKSLEQTVAACNAKLGRDGIEQSVSKSTIKRYLAALDKATVPIVHQPQLARENARVAIAFEERLNRLDQLLGQWLDEATDAEKVTVVGSGESAYEVRSIDWNARTSVAREMNRHLAAYADLMQRIHDAEQVKAFQESVLDAIREVEPDVAAVILAKLRERQSIRKATVLGL